MSSPNRFALFDKSSSKKAKQEAEQKAQSSKKSESRLEVFPRTRTKTVYGTYTADFTSQTMTREVEGYHRSESTGNFEEKLTQQQMKKGEQWQTIAQKEKRTGRKHTHFKADGGVIGTRDHTPTSRGDNLGPNATGMRKKAKKTYNAF